MHQEGAGAGQGYQEGRQHSTYMARGDMWLRCYPWTGGWGCDSHGVVSCHCLGCSHAAALGKVVCPLFLGPMCLNHAAFFVVNPHSPSSCCCIVAVGLGLLAAGSLLLQVGRALPCSTDSTKIVLSSGWCHVWWAVAVLTTAGLPSQVGGLLLERQQHG
jgi:hypothetical protein